MVRGLCVPFVGLALISHTLSYPVQSVFLPSRGRGSRGAVASESTICSQIGIDLINHGVCLSSSYCCESTECHVKV